MRRAGAWSAAFLFAGLASSGPAFAQTQISIGDVRVVEGSPAGITQAVFPVTLSAPSAGIVAAVWATRDGTATAPGDYTAALPGIVAFLPGEVYQEVIVDVVQDVVVEPDETFYVDLSNPVGGALLKRRGVGTILDDDATRPGVTGLVVVSDSDLGSGRNRLEWLNPVFASAPMLRIRWNTRPNPCGVGDHPASPDPLVDPVPGLVDIALDPARSRASQIYEHTGLTFGTNYCYTVWVVYSGPVYSTPAQAKGRPFDSTGPVRWKYFTGATAMTAPAVGLDAVVGVSNDLGVHAMQRGPSGGLWPTQWSPVGLGGVAQNRSPVVTTGGVPRVYIASQDGRVQAIDVTSGAVLWSTLLTPADATTPSAQAAPAGIFTAFGGAWDYILVGTNVSTSANRFYALDPADGSIIDYFPKAGDDAVVPMGPIPQMASVDYASRRVYFGLLSSNNADYSLLCLNLGPPPNALSFGWGLTQGNIDQTETSPVLRGGRVYVASDKDDIWSIPADTGSFAGSYKRSVGAGGVKGFIFPDRRNGDLYFATTGKVQAFTDTGVDLVKLWDNTVPDASMVVLWPGTNYLYAGSSNVGGNQAGLVQIDVSGGGSSPLKAVVLEPSQIIMGAPSIDIGNNLAHLGSVAGTFYAVQVPLP